MRKRIAVIILLFIIVAVVVTIVERSFKTDAELVRVRIDEFEKAYNGGDLEGVLSCMDRKNQNKYEGSIGILNGLIGLSGLNIGLENLFGVGVGMSDDDVMSIKIDKINIDGGTAVVNGKMTLYGVTQSAAFDMVKENNNWYIKKIK